MGHNDQAVLPSCGWHVDFKPQPVCCLHNVPPPQHQSQQPAPCYARGSVQCTAGRHISRRRAGRGCIHLLLVLLLALCPRSSWGARLYRTLPQGVQPSTLREWQTLLLRLDRLTAFEEAYSSVFAQANLTATLQQYGRVVSFLATSAGPAYVQIHELHNPLIRELVFEAMNFGAMTRFDEGAALASLDLISSRLSQASSRMGYPVARRMVIGAILKQRTLLGQPFSRDVQLHVDRILLLLFGLHKHAATNKGAIQFFHISKSGGTNLCMTAQANGCSTQGFDGKHNCLVKEFWDIPRWVSPSAHKYVYFRLTNITDPDGVINPWFVNFHTERKSMDNCAERRSHLRVWGWDFYANEFTTPPGEVSLCREFVNLMMWRHPLERLTSQIGWIQKLYHDVFGDDNFDDAFEGRTSRFWESLVPAGVSNYYIRSLLGPRFFEYPILPVNATHVQRAKVQVLLHDLLLLLSNKEWNDLTLKFGLGWDSGLFSSNIRSSSDLKDELHMPVDYEVLQLRNSADVEVYEFVQQVAALDMVLWSFVAALDAQLGLRTLTSNKCGYVNLDH